MLFIHTKSTVELAIFPFRVDLMMMRSMGLMKFGCIGHLLALMKHYYLWVYGNLNSGLIYVYKACFNNFKR
jgi:hypothetical protein